MMICIIVCMIVCMGIIVCMICITGILVIRRYHRMYNTCNRKYNNNNNRYDMYNSRYSRRADWYNSWCNSTYKVGIIRIGPIAIVGIIADIITPLVMSITSILSLCSSKGPG